MRCVYKRRRISLKGDQLTRRRRPLSTKRKRSPSHFESRCAAAYTSPLPLSPSHQQGAASVNKPPPALCRRRHFRPPLPPIQAAVAARRPSSTNGLIEVPAPWSQVASWARVLQQRQRYEKLRTSSSHSRLRSTLLKLSLRSVRPTCRVSLRVLSVIVPCPPFAPSLLCSPHTTGYFGLSH